MAEGETGYKIDTTGFSGKAASLSQMLNNLGDGLDTALQEIFVHVKNGIEQCSIDP